MLAAISGSLDWSFTTKGPVRKNRPRPSKRDAVRSLEIGATSDPAAAMIRASFAIKTLYRPPPTASLAPQAALSQGRVRPGDLADVLCRRARAHDRPPWLRHHRVARARSFGAGYSARLRRDVARAAGAHRAQREAIRPAPPRHLPGDRLDFPAQGRRLSAPRCVTGAVSPARRRARWPPPP